MDILGPYTRKQAAQIALGALLFLGDLPLISQNASNPASMLGGIVGALVGIAVVVLVATAFYDYTKWKFFNDRKIRFGYGTILGFIVFVSFAPGIAIGIAIGNVPFGIFLAFLLSLVLVVLPANQTKGRKRHSYSAKQARRQPI